MFLFRWALPSAAALSFPFCGCTNICWLALAGPAPGCALQGFMYRLYQVYIAFETSDLDKFLESSELPFLSLIAFHIVDSFLTLFLICLQWLSVLSLCIGLFSNMPAVMSAGCISPWDCFNYCCFQAALGDFGKKCLSVMLWQCA